MNLETVNLNYRYRQGWSIWFIMVYYYGLTSQRRRKITITWFHRSTDLTESRQPAPGGRQVCSAKGRILLATFGLTASERTRQLLSFAGVDESTPSELMDHISGLLGNNKACFIFI